MTTEPSEPQSQYPAGKLVIKYLHENKDGATLAQILQHLRNCYGKDSADVTRTVELVLESGTDLGFLERKGSHYVNWMARELCCRRRRCRRRSRCRRRRRRRIRRRRSRCRRRRRRY
ncbi:hypothetical protein O3G_MSEX007663 [Manduca sexta]|uniref:DUF4777 domain-containing protein n=1 Tax=Manduca sexta TaxID=7130 RepID=A0A922CMG2_MANSE|nr:hypothetical protein O3G_MSEX007663 [Manduca sexta]